MRHSKQVLTPLMRHPWFFVPFLAYLVLFCSVAAGQDYGRLKAQVMDLGKLTTAPEIHAVEGRPSEGELRALYFDGVPYRGKPTRVFAWYGVPAKHDAKMPGIVLVHGGGGTAFKQWVQKWNDHGFAAISIAVEGQTDEREPDSKLWKRHAWAGPARNDIYGDSAAPLADQWIYHAVADTILANSLLRSFPEVDSDKIGLMGISWGGVIASIVIGIDGRFAFAIPTYGCGALAEAENQYGQALKENALYRNVWDPVIYLPNAKMPVLWFTWLHDAHFPLTSQSACYRAAAGPCMVAVLKDMRHSHQAGWNPPDSYAFAVSVVRDEKPWLSQIAQRQDQSTAFAEFTSTKVIERAILFSTTDSGFTGTRKWIETPAVPDQHDGLMRLSAPLPENTRAWFFNLYAGDLTTSSKFVEVVP